MRQVAFVLSMMLLLPGCTGQRRSTPAPPAEAQAAQAQPAPPRSAPSLPLEPSPAPASPVKDAPPLAAVRFVNAQTGWAAGNGVILASTDGGQTWTRQYTTSANITALDFVSPTIGWALGPDVFLRTTNGGQDWEAPPVPDGKVPQSVEFVTATLGWSTDGSALYETRDGGQNWAKVTVPGPAQSVCFADESTGWVAGAKSVFQTQDGGKTWKTSFTVPVQGDQWTSETHCSGKAAWVLYRGGVGMNQQSYIVYRTLDAGATWQPVLKQAYFSANYPTAGAVQQQTDAYSGPFAVSGDGANFLGQCPACGDGGTVSLTRTTDGGKMFTHANIPGLRAVRKYGLDFADADQGWVVGSPGEHGIILTTKDGGRTWKQVLPPEP